MSLNERADICCSKTPVGPGGTYDKNGKGVAKCLHDKASHAFNVYDHKTQTAYPRGDCLVSGCECKGYVSREEMEVLEKAEKEAKARKEAIGAWL